MTRTLATNREVQKVNYLVREGDFLKNGNVNMVKDGDMEFNNDWSNYNLQAGDVQEQSTTQVKEGTYSRHILVAGTGRGATSGNFIKDIVAGHTYRIDAWVYVVSGVAYLRRNNSRIDFSIQSTTTGQWENIRADVVAGSSGAERIRLETYGAGGEYYVDSIKVTDLDFEEEIFGDFEDITPFVVSGTGATITEDTEHYKNGDNSMKLTSVNAVSAYATLTKCFSLKKVSTFSFWLYIDDVSKMFQNTVSLVNIYTGSSDYFLYSIVGSQMRTGWNRIVFSKDECTVGGGSPNWNQNCQKIMLRALSLSGETVSISFDDFRTTRYEKPKVIISFDDANETDYTEAFTYMSQFGLKGVCFSPPTKFGLTNQLTLEQAKEMYDAGWDIGNHSYSHVDLTTLSDEEVIEELQSEASFLIANGMPRAAYYLAWPFSALDDRTVSLARNAGIVAARTGVNGTSPHEVQELLKVKRGSVSNTMSESELKSYVDNVIKKGGVLIYNFHDISSPADASTDCLPTTFKAVIDYIVLKQRQGLIDVVTFTEWHNGL